MPQRCESSLSSSFSSPSPSPSLALRLLLPLAAFLPPSCRRRRRRRRSRLGWLVLARVVRGSSGGGGGGGGRVFADPTSARVSTVVMVECAVHRGPIGTPPSRARSRSAEGAATPHGHGFGRRRGGEVHGPPSATRPDGDVGRPELASWAYLAARAAGRPGGGPGRQWARKGRVAVPSALVLGSERDQGWCTARRGHADAPPFGSFGSVVCGAWGLCSNLPLPTVDATDGRAPFFGSSPAPLLYSSKVRQIEPLSAAHSGAHRHCRGAAKADR